VIAFVAGVAQPVASNCFRDSIGLVPLNDLDGGFYKGKPGGLYPTGDYRPSAHEIDGVTQANSVQPLNRLGRPDPAGRIVLLSIGMSNTKSEFATFQFLARSDSTLNPRLVIVNGAKSGASSKVIAHPETTKGQAYWEEVNSLLNQSNVTPAQVQIAWVKVAEANPTGTFPIDALRLKADLGAIARILKLKFPNIRLAYYSSRIYAGYTTTSLNPEPYAYQSGFAAKWIIEDQIKGDPTLNFDSHFGPVVAPWIAWGPYLWADGDRPRSDGLTWACRDFSSDGTHPSATGANKVAVRLMDFFKRDTTTRRWFLQSKS